MSVQIVPERSAWPDDDHTASAEDGYELKLFQTSAQTLFTSVGSCFRSRASSSSDTSVDTLFRRTVFLP